MEKKGIFLPQETQETCGISCLLMALTAFGKIKKPKPSLSDEESAESIFYKMYGFMAEPGKRMGTLGGAIAYALSCRRLDVELWHESEHLIDNREGYYPPELHARMLEEQQAYISKAQGAFAVRKGMEIGADALIDQLQRDRLLIVQCFIEGDADGMHDHVLHWILVFDYKDEEFYAYDPLYTPPSRKAPNYIRIGKDEMMAYMNTPLGASLISVGESI